MAKPGVMFYFDVRPCIKRLSLNEKGRLFEAILDYGEFGTIPDLDGALGVAWDFIQPKLDRDAGRYDKQVEQKQYAVFAREMKKNGGHAIPFEEWRALSADGRNRLLSADTERYPTTTSNYNLQPHTTTPTNCIIEADKPPTRHSFSPPSVDEVRKYCEENNLHIDTARFVDFYTSKGWMVGTSKMTDWQATVRNWARKEKPNAGKTESKPTYTVGTTV